jgi:cytochrome b6-f complex iron-sulfur subunit
MTSDEVPEKKSINRREFLNIAWLASLGFLTVNIAGVTYLFAMPRFKEGEFGGVVTAGTVADLPPSDASPDDYPKVKFWLSNSEEGLVALYTVCTHLGCLFSWNNQEAKYICPCHGSQFDKEGDYLRGPAPRSLDRFMVQIVSQDGEVLAQTDPSTGDPVEVPKDPNAEVKVDTGKKIQGDTHA